MRLLGQQEPRVIILDHTRAGDGTATGELKANLFEAWSPSSLLHVFEGFRHRIGISGIAGNQIFDRRWASRRYLNLAITAFEPDCILYRPVPDTPHLHRYSMDFIRKSSAPLVVWLMDDWPARLRQRAEEKQVPLLDDLSWLIQHSRCRLCISDPMQGLFEQRYGASFFPLANGVNLDSWPDRAHQPSDVFTVRYAGGLADDMALDSVLRVAEAIDCMARGGTKIRFEINTRPSWGRRYGGRFTPFSSCTLSTKSLSSDEYRRFLQEAGVVLIAYNFDDRSRTYVQNSLANKLPECLASGRPLLLHSPSDMATAQEINRELADSIVDQPNVSAIRCWLQTVMDSENRQADLARRGRELAAARFSLQDRQQRLRRLLNDLSI